MTRRIAPRAVALAAALLLMAAGRAHAHGLEPALLSLREMAPGRFEVVWKSSKIRLPGALVRPILPDACRQTADPPQADDDGDRLRLRWIVDCGADGFAGHAIGVADLDVATIDALLRVERLDGASMQTVLTARQPTWTAPADPDRRQLLRHYASLGAERMLDGLDRLLLVVGLLLLLAPTPRRLFQGAVAFAIGHSLALALVAVGVVAVPARAVEILIAVGLLFVAVELTREGGRRPLGSAWWVALAFGVVCGCAFAGALAETGIPTIDAPLALLAFNLGIALAQLAALAVAFTVGGVVARHLPRATALATRVAAYGMGITAALWCFERLAA